MDGGTPDRWMVVRPDGTVRDRRVVYSKWYTVVRLYGNLVVSSVGVGTGLVW